MALIQLISVGSRGDLEPYLALLLELQRLGHSVTLIGSTNFADAARKAAIAFAPLPGNFRDLLGSPAGRELMQGKPVRLVSDALLQQWLTTAREAIRGAIYCWYHLNCVAPCITAGPAPRPPPCAAGFPPRWWLSSRTNLPGAEPWKNSASARLPITTPRSQPQPWLRACGPWRRSPATAAGPSSSAISSLRRTASPRRWRPWRRF